MIYLLTALFICGIRHATEEGQILHRFSEWIKGILTYKVVEEEYIGDHIYHRCHYNQYAIYKPIFGCVWCMASLWCVIPYLLFFDISWWSFLEYPFFAAAVSFISGCLWLIFLKLSDENI